MRMDAGSEEAKAGNQKKDGRNLKGEGQKRCTGTSLILRSGAFWVFSGIFFENGKMFLDATPVEHYIAKKAIWWKRLSQKRTYKEVCFLALLGESH